MKIQLGTIYYNKTKKYLLPCLQYYGPVFVDKFVNLFKLAVGIGDFYLEDLNFNLKSHIFILIDTNLSRRSFTNTLEWIRIQEYYAFDYAFDDLHLGHLHMIIIKFPKEYEEAMRNFKDGNYSKMYDVETLEKFFKEKEEVKVFIKDKEYCKKFVDNVNETFKTTVDSNEWNGELEFPMESWDEFFNVKN